MAAAGFTYLGVGRNNLALLPQQQRVQPLAGAEEPAHAARAQAPVKVRRPELAEKALAAPDPSKPSAA